MHLRIRTALAWLSWHMRQHSLGYVELTVITSNYEVRMFAAAKPA